MQTNSKLQQKELSDRSFCFFFSGRTFRQPVPVLGREREPPPCAVMKMTGERRNWCWERNQVLVSRQAQGQLGQSET